MSTFECRDGQIIGPDVLKAAQDLLLLKFRRSYKARLRVFRQETMWRHCLGRHLYCDSSHGSGRDQDGLMMASSDNKECDSMH